MGDILMSMGILPSRTSDVAAFKDRLSTPFLAAYVAALPDARPYPVVLGGQEFTEALQQHIEAVQYGQETAAAAEAAAQADATSILGKAAK
jgi:multiple sugar transport system substrate-binding protein